MNESDRLRVGIEKILSDYGSCEDTYGLLGRMRRVLDGDLLNSGISEDEFWWMGFDSAFGKLYAGANHGLMDKGLVPPYATVTIPSRPQIETFRGWRLFVDRKHADQFLIHDIRVVNCCTTACASPIPASAFITDLSKLASIEELFKQNGQFQMKVDKTGAQLLGTEWCLPTAHVGSEITMLVENTSCDYVRFVAGMLGYGPPHHR